MLDSSEKATTSWTRKLPVLNIKTPNKSLPKKQAENPAKNRFTQNFFPLIKDRLESARDIRSFPPSNFFIEEASTKESLEKFCAPKKGPKGKFARKAFKSPRTVIPFPPNRNIKTARKNFKSIESRFNDEKSDDLNDVSFGDLDDRFYGPENIFKSMGNL